MPESALYWYGNEVIEWIAPNINGLYQIDSSPCVREKKTNSLYISTSGVSHASFYAHTPAEIYTGKTVIKGFFPSFSGLDYGSANKTSYIEIAKAVPDHAITSNFIESTRAGDGSLYRQINAFNRNGSGENYLGTYPLDGFQNDSWIAITSWAEPSVEIAAIWLE